MSDRSTPGYRQRFGVRGAGGDVQDDRRSAKRRPRPALIDAGSFRNVTVASGIAMEGLTALFFDGHRELNVPAVRAPAS